jgi:hypothetical protein
MSELRVGPANTLLDSYMPLDVTILLQLTSSYWHFITEHLHRGQKEMRSVNLRMSRKKPPALSLYRLAHSLVGLLMKTK